MRHGVGPVKCRFPKASLRYAFRNLTQRTLRKATESTEGALERNRDRRLKKKDRILCGSLGAFVPSVFYFSDFSAENMEFFSC